MHGKDRTCIFSIVGKLDANAISRKHLEKAVASGFVPFDPMKMPIIPMIKETLAVFCSSQN